MPSDSQIATHNTKKLKPMSWCIIIESLWRKCHQQSWQEEIPSLKWRNMCLSPTIINIWFDAGSSAKRQEKNYCNCFPYFMNAENELKNYKSCILKGITKIYNQIQTKQSLKHVGAVSISITLISKEFQISSLWQ